MKRTILTLMLAVCLLIVSAGAYAEGLPSRPDVLPVPPTGANDSALPQPGGGGSKQNPLPNPGSFFGSEGELADEAFQFEGASYEVWYYDMVPGWNEQMNTYLMECTVAGYEWNYQTISGSPAYVFTAGGLRAMLFVDYYGKIMLMKQDGITMDEVELPGPIELEKGKLRLILNGEVINFDGGKAFSGGGEIVCRFFEQGTAAIIDVRLPLNITTASQYSLNQKNKRDNYDEFLVEYRRQQYSQSHFHSSADYINASITYAQITSWDLPREIKGHYEGVFDGGKNTLVIDFYTGYSY